MKKIVPQDTMTELLCLFLNWKLNYTLAIL